MSCYSKTTLRKGEAKTHAGFVPARHFSKRKTGTSIQEEAMLLGETAAATGDALLAKAGLKISKPQANIQGLLF